MPDGTYVRPSNIFVNPVQGIDFVTVATSRGPRLTKRWYLDAAGGRRCENYDKAKLFDFATKPVRNLGELQQVLDGLAPTQCLILGKLKDGVDPNGALRRLHDKNEPATIEDIAHHWLPVDIDNIAAVDEAGEFDPIADPARAAACVIRRLPPEFRDPAHKFLWQHTSSAGIKPGIRQRLFFWLDRPLTGAEMKAWLAPLRVCDSSIYTPTQPIYAAAPVFEDVADPVARRIGRNEVGRIPAITPPAVIEVQQTQRRLDVAPGCEMDAPHVQQRVRSYLQGLVNSASPSERDSGLWGQEGDCKTYDIGCKIGDFGCSEEVCVDLMVEMLPGGEAEREWFENGAVHNAYYYRQNAIGCDYRPAVTGAGTWQEYDAQARAGGQQTAATVYPRGHRGSALRLMKLEPVRWAWRNRIMYGRPMILPGDKGTGKTSLALGAAVASLGGVPYLGEPLERMPWLIMLGEDDYQTADETLAGLCRDMGVPESVLDDIHVLSAVDDEIPGGPMLCRIAASRTNSAEVLVEQTPYMTDLVLPLLDELRHGGPAGFIIDPLDKFVEFDRNNTTVARAVNDRWLEPLCRSRPGLTPWLNDHPSKQGMKDGFGYGGAPGLVNAIPSFLALRKKLDRANKPIVEEYEGIRQVSLELETVRVKRAPETRLNLYRIGDSPLLRLKPASGLTLVSTMARVYEAVERYRAADQRVRMDAKSSSTRGPGAVAEDLQVSESLVRDAMKALCEIGLYVHRNAATSGHAPRDPGGLMPGDLYDYLRNPTPERLYREMERQGKLSRSPVDQVTWQRVELEGELEY